MSVSGRNVFPPHADAGPLMTVWADGWAATRARPQPVETPYGRYIHVDRPDQIGRHVIAEGAEAFVAPLAAGLTIPGMDIKAFGTPAAIGAMLPAGWAVEPAVWLMNTTLETGGDREVTPAGYVAAIAGERAISVELRDRDGDVGATGRAAVVGHWCVFDQIVTAEAHRRRGLGSAVMRLLGREAASRGADRGLLVATDDGRALYERLGWSLNGAVTSATLG